MCENIATENEGEMNMEPKEPIKITEPTLLLVEGKDDMYFCQELINHMGLRNIQIMYYEGIYQLTSFLKFNCKSDLFFEKVSSLGIIRDADTDSEAAFQSIQHALQTVNLPEPKKPLVSFGNSPRVTIMLWPRNCSQGRLEDLCLEAVAKDPAMDCVEQFFICLKEKNLPEPNSISKAKFQVFLASRPKLKHHLGLAAKAGYLPWGNEAFKKAKYFLQQICGEI